MEATRERPNPNEAANNCDECGADFPNAEALGRHLDLAHPHDGSKGNDRPTPPQGQWNNPGTESGPSKKAEKPASGGGPYSPEGEPPKSSDKMGGESKKDGQIPYGSQRPNPEGGSDEGRAMRGERKNPGASVARGERNDASAPGEDDSAEPGGAPPMGRPPQPGNAPGVPSRGDERSADPPVRGGPPVRNPPGSAAGEPSDPGEGAGGKDKNRSKKSTEGRDDHRPAPGNVPQPY
jgi:hypothetical protein